jgi:VCBS repeat-containing protein
MRAAHRIGGYRAVRAIVAAAALGALAGPASAATSHGVRVSASEPVRVTSAAINRASAAHAPRGRALPARPGASTRSPNPHALSTPRAQAQSEPRTSFASPLNFAGPSLADSGAFPPDTQGAVGPAQFLVTINGRFRSYGKATGLPDGALNADPDVFFASVMSPAPPGGIVFTSDPHVRYDRLSQRWFIVMIDAPRDASKNFSVANRILVAMSDGPVLTGSTVWTKRSIEVNGVFADYPTLGVDANALYVGTNNFSLTGREPFVSTSGYVIQKSSVASETLVFTKFDLVTSATGAGPFTPQGVDDPDPGAASGYFVGVDNAVFSKLDVVRILNPGGGSPTATAALGVNVPTTGSPIDVPHLGNTGGSANNLDALDDRLFVASMRGNRIWTAHNIGVNSSGVASGTSTRDGSRWYELDVSGTPSLVQNGTMFDGAASNPLSYWIPTVAVSGQGHMAIGGSVSGATHHPDAWFSGRLSGDAAGTTDAPTVYTASTDNYNPGNNRWGDYSAVSLDPTDDMTMWTIQEHVAGTGSWGTRIAKLRAPPPAIPASVSTRALAGQPSVPVTLTGTTSDGRGFFDPGPAFTRPQVTAGCGVLVTAVAVNSPSQASLTLDTRAATNAPCVLTFTNPDGQVASAPVNLLERAPQAVDDVRSVAPDAVLNASSVLANDSDPDGDALTAAKASDPAHGAVTVNTDGTFTYTPAAGYTGPDAFTYTASDGTLQDTGTVSITVSAVSNHAPVATDDAYSVAQDTVLNGSSVLANDSDPDGDALTAAKASDPAHGAVTVNTDGTFTYTPAAGYSGPDAFTYTVSDGTLQDTGTVSITVTAAQLQQQQLPPPVTQQQPLPDLSNPGTLPAPITKLTLKLKKLKPRNGKLRLQASGRGPKGAKVRVVLRRGKRWITARTVKVVKGRWRVVFRVRRHGRYRVTATSGAQRVSARKRL